ncbi:MAG: hypothetical protein LQ338_002789 [Usnochroma carphineum]|nr:MAG: hypothetical protein LQ338_002789 [Usnochroma carphineum]
MSRRIITDFFKPSAFPQQTKRLPPDAELEKPRPSQRSRSNTPHAAEYSTSERPKPSTASTDTILISSQSSAPSSSHDVPSSAPEELPRQISAISTVKAKGTLPASPLLSDVALSQAPVISSSQRITKNGEVVIRDSDEDRSDSESSLEDIDDLLGRRKPPAESSSVSEDVLPPVPSPPATRSKSGKSAVGGHTRSAAATANHSPTPIAIPKYKFSLNALIKQRRKDEDSRAIIENAQNLLLEGLEEQKPSSTGTPNAALDENLLATVIKNDDDEGNMDRLMAAIERTDALDQQKTWSFFRDKDDGVDAEPAECPTVADPYWRSIFDDPLTRQQAFLTGYVGECSSLRKLPDKLLIWLLGAACHEPRDDLHHSYCQAIRDIGDQVTQSLTVETCNNLLKAIGARPEALDLKKAAVPTVTTPHASQSSAHAKLRRILNVYSAVTASVSMPVKANTMCILSRLLLDREIINDCTLLSNIVEIISAVFEGMDHDGLNDDVTAAFTTIYDSVQNPCLQLQLLRNLPAFSPRSSLLRRRLALAYFFHDRTYLSRDREHLTDFQAIVRYLNGSCFSVNSGTDYLGLAASIAILAIGIDNADAPPVDSSREAQATFNDNVDILAQKIKAMFTQIVDTGASHMKRTEAKQVLETFHSYLVYAVRTKQKPRGIICGDDARTEKQKRMMSGFAQRPQRGMDNNA